MTAIARDTPDRKFAIGTSERAAGEDVITHTWRKYVTGEHTKVCYMIGLGTSSCRGNRTAARLFPWWIIPIIIEGYRCWRQRRGADLFPDQSWQNWEITVETAKVALPLSQKFNDAKDRPVATIRVDLRLPRISPYVCSEDFTAYSAEGIQVPCHATSKLVPYPEWYTFWSHGVPWNSSFFSSQSRLISAPGLSLFVKTAIAIFCFCEIEVSGSCSSWWSVLSLSLARAQTFASNSTLCYDMVIDWGPWGDCLCCKSRQWAATCKIKNKNRKRNSSLLYGWLIDWLNPTHAGLGNWQVVCCPSRPESARVGPWYGLWTNVPPHDGALEPNVKHKWQWHTTLATCYLRWLPDTIFIPKERRYLGTYVW